MTVEAPDLRAATPGTLLASAAGGLVTGAFGAYCYYDALLRPISHTFGVWVVLVAVVAARRAARQAMLHASVALIAAVVAFYLGKAVMYGLRYPGSPYTPNLSTIGLWCLLAVVAGCALGGLLRGIGRSGLFGSIAAASALGLLVADVLQRTDDFPDEAPVLVAVALLGVVVLARLAGAAGRRQVWQILLLTVPAALVAAALVAAPDIVEGVVLFG